MATCQETGGDAFDALIMSASSDGKVSRDEINIIVWYCRQEGATFDRADLEKISALNTSVNMRVKSTTTIDSVLSSLEFKDSAQAIRLYAAMAAIRKPWTRPSNALDTQLAGIISRTNVAPPAPTA
jgi:hypothetical protein